MTEDVIKKIINEYQATNFDIYNKKQELELKSEFLERLSKIQKIHDDYEKTMTAIENGTYKISESGVVQK